MPPSKDIEPSFIEPSFMFCIYAGESLVNSEAEHIHVLLDEGAYTGILCGDQSAWAILLFIVNQEIAT